MEKQCKECKQYTTGLMLDELCIDCYGDFFEFVMKNDEEPDFVLESDVAKIVKTNPFIVSTELTNFTIPKAYKIDFDKAGGTQGLMLLLEAVLREVTFYDNHPMFDEIKPLLKEV